jgi:hypothetical protein
MPLQEGRSSHIHSHIHRHGIVNGAFPSLAMQNLRKSLPMPIASATRPVMSEAISDPFGTATRARSGCHRRGWATFSTKPAAFSISVTASAVMLSRIPVLVMLTVILGRTVMVVS